MPEDSYWISQFVFHSKAKATFEIKLIGSQECIPVGCVLPAAVAGGVSTRAPQEQTRRGLHQAPPQEHTPREQIPPWRPAARHAGIPPAMHAGIALPRGQNHRRL